MNLINSCLPGERRLQSVFVPLFLGSTKAMQIVQNICSKFIHKHIPTINAMLAVNSEPSESLGVLTRTGFAAEVQPRI